MPAIYAANSNREIPYNRLNFFVYLFKDRHFFKEVVYYNREFPK